MTHQVKRPPDDKVPALWGMPPRTREQPRNRRSKIFWNGDALAHRS